ncbi:MAG: PfkB family carbohydrate kinase [bacterium]
MSILVVGTVAFDSVKTPFGEVERALGGSATYFSTSSSYFHQTNLVAVVGKDFRENDRAVFEESGIDTRGLETMEGETFHWKGEYGYDLNEAKTLATHLNVLEKFVPRIPECYRNPDILFLANVDPDIQRKVVEQVNKPKLTACDTMNFWIDVKRDSLKETIALVDLLVINEAEIRQLSEEVNLVKAAKLVASWGPKIIIVKQGEYGAILFYENEIFVAPAYPLEAIYDPTGAGDSFAGGLIGHLARVKKINKTTLRQAIIMGSVMASFNVESFSLNSLRSLDHHKIAQRFHEFKDLTHFELIEA